MTLPLEVRSTPGPARRVLGLDPGTSMGWAVVDATEDGSITVVASGVFRLPRGGHPGTRYRQLRRYLRGLLGRYQPTVVALEDVRHHVGTRAAHIYGGIRAHIEEVCCARELAVLPINVSTVKQRATGSGRASKEAMCEAAETLLGRIAVSDDEADGLFVALCGCHHEAL